MGTEEISKSLLDMSFLSDAIGLISGMGAKINEVVELPDSEEAVRFMIRGQDGVYRTELIPRPSRPRQHLFTTVASFLDYIVGPLCKNQIAVFVGDDIIEADLNYKHPHLERALVELTPSEERRALDRLAGGVSQRELWRLLVTDLAGCLDNSLLSQISGVKLKKSTSSNVSDLGILSFDQTINLISITTSSGKDAAATAKIDREWTWTGRIWTCWDQTFKIDLRLEFDDQSGKFIFRPVRLSQTVNEAIAKLVEHLNTEVAARVAKGNAKENFVAPRICIYSGRGNF